MTAPTCIHCAAPARLVGGKKIYPHRKDLWEKPVWLCDCGAYVGCHPGTTESLGRPANAELRKARMHVHDKLDPLWRNQRKGARSIVYAFLADKLGMTSDECHTGLFDIEACRRAWRTLNDVTFAEIMDWERTRGKAEVPA